MKLLLKAALAAFFFATNICFAQSVKLNSKSLDFGSHNLWNSPYLALELTNISNKSIAILRVSAARGVWYDYPRQYVKPGETVEISFTYYTDIKGAFSENIDIYVSSEMKPIQINLKGNIKGFAFDALTACPAWNKPESKPMEYDHTIQVIDDITNQPIKGVSIAVLQRNEAIGFWKTPSSGKVNMSIPAGLFGIQIKALGYIGIEEGLTLEMGGTQKVYRLKRENLPLAQVEISQNNLQKIPKDEKEVELAEFKPLPLDTLAEEMEYYDDILDTIQIGEPSILLSDNDPYWTNSVLPIEEYKPNNIIFLLDVSSSMNTPARFPLLKQSLLELSGVMRSSDRISVITFTSNSKILLTNIPGYQQDTLYQIFNKLRASGSTNGIKGLETAYKMAQENFISDGNNVVILATDGVFRIVEKNVNAEDLVKTYAKKGIKLSIVGLGSDAAALENLKNVAERGEGEFYRMSPQEESSNALIDIIKKLSRRK